MSQSDKDDGAKVLLLGVFHFANPGLDQVKMKAKDVMDEESQGYLEELSQRIQSLLKPTAVLLEYDPKNDEVINNSYRDYVQGNHSLAPDEVEQLGFRIARLCELERVHSFDVRDIPIKA